MKMQIPIVMAAFGTTTRAEATYKRIDAKIREAFPEHDIHWSYSSRMITERRRKSRNGEIFSPHEVLRQLHDQGYPWAVVQSVHLTCGHEFYRLVDQVRTEPIRSSMGLPLLTSPDDHRRTAQCLEPMIRTHPDKAVLLLGHGTDHPTWTAYPAFQQALREIFGNRVYVGVVEHFPPSDDLIAQITRAGFKEALLIPFMLVAGVHYHNDLMSDEPDSWRSRLTAAGIIPEAVPDGLGQLPCIGEIFCDHIRAALDAIPR